MFSIIFLYTGQKLDLSCVLCPGEFVQMNLTKVDPSTENKMAMMTLNRSPLILKTRWP